MPNLTANLETVRRALSKVRCTCPTTAHGTPILSATCPACEARKALRELEGVDQRIATLHGEADELRRKMMHYRAEAGIARNDLAAARQQAAREAVEMLGSLKLQDVCGNYVHNAALDGAVRKLRAHFGLEGK